MFENTYNWKQYSVAENIDDPDALLEGDYDVYCLDILPDHVVRKDGAKPDADDLAEVKDYANIKLANAGLVNMSAYAYPQGDEIRVDIMFQ